MAWLLAGATTLLLSWLAGLADGLFDVSLDATLRGPLPFPAPAGPLGDLLLYGGWIGLVYFLALAGWGLGLRLWLEGVQEREERYDRVLTTLSVGGQRWPYALITLAVGAAAASVFEARIGLLGPAVASLTVVVAVSLVGHALSSPSPPRLDEPPPPVPPPAPITRTLDERLAALKETVAYHGQIAADEVLPAPAGSTVPIAGELAVEPLATLWQAAAGGVVYEHQRRTLELLRDRTHGRRALLLTPRGSGVEVTLAAAILERVAQGGTVLVLCPDPRSMARFWREISGLLGQLPLPWAPSCVILDERRAPTAPDPYVELSQDQLGRHAVVLAEGTAAKLTGEVLLATPGSLHATLLAHSESWKTWLETLDLTMVLDADRYRAAPGGHAALVLRRLRRVLTSIGRDPAVLAVGLDVQDPLGTCERLWHWSLTDEQIVRIDGTPAAARRFVLWQPNLDTTAERAGGPIPGDSLAEAVQLLDALTMIGERPALVTTHAAVANDDLEAMRQSARQLGSHSAGGRPAWTPPIVDSFDALWRLEHPPTAVVTFAFPSDLHRFEHETRHLGRGQELLLFVIAPPLPSAQLLVRRTQAIALAGPSAGPAAVRGASLVRQRTVTSQIVPPAPPFLATVQQRLLQRHLLRAIAEMTETADSLSDLGSDGSAAYAVQQLIAERAVITSDRFELADPVAAAAALLADLDGVERPALQLTQQLRPAGAVPPATAAQLQSVDDDPVEVQVAGTTVHVVDREMADVMLYPGRILVHNRLRYVVERPAGRPLGARVGLQPFAGGRIATSRITRPTVRPPDGSRWQLDEIEIGGGLRARAGVVDATVEELIEGYHQFSWLEPANPVITTSYAEPLKATIQTRALLLALPVESGLTASPGVLHTLEHVARAVLPLVLDVRADEVGFTSESAPADLEGTPALVIYDLAPGGNGLADALRERLSALLTAALSLMESCPCADGCLACIRLPDCRRRAANEEMDKAEALRLLGGLLGRQQAIKARLARGTTVATDEQSEAIRQALLSRIFPTQIGLNLESAERAPMRLYSLDDLGEHPDWPARLADVGGLYVHSADGAGPGTVWVRRYPVEDITAVIAHEYAHNWQFTGGGPHPDVTADRRPFVRTLLVEGFARWVEYKVLEAAGYLHPLRAAEAYLEQHPEYPVGLRFFRYLESKHGQQAPIRLFTDGWGALDLDRLLDESGCQSELLNAYEGFSADWFDPGEPPESPEPEEPPAEAS